MRPMKSFQALSKWLLRIAVVVIVYVRFFDIITTFSFNSFSYFVALAIAVFAVLLFIGGFTKASKLTVLSSLFLVLLCLLQLFAVYGFGVDSVLQVIPLLAIGIHFMARGNLS